MVWLPVSEIFNVPTDIEARDCTRGLYRHPERVYPGSWLSEKNPFSCGDLKSCQHCPRIFSRTLPTELSLPQEDLWRRSLCLERIFLLCFWAPQSSVRLVHASPLKVWTKLESGNGHWNRKCATVSLCWLSLLVPSIFMHWEYFWGLQFGAPRCSAMWVCTVCVLLMNGVYAWKGLFSVK